VVLLVVVLVLVFSRSGSPPPPAPGPIVEVDPPKKGNPPQVNPKEKEKEKEKDRDKDKKPEPEGPLFAKGPVRFLSEMPEFDVVPGEWPFRKGDVGDGKPIEVAGVRSPHGLGMHPPHAVFGKPGYAAVKYRLNKQAELLKATVAINDTTKWCFSPATFTVLGDGKQLWRSNEITHQAARSQECAVPVKGVDVLELRVQVANGQVGVHAVWVEPRVYLKAGAAKEGALKDKDPGEKPAPAIKLFAKGQVRFLSELPAFDKVMGEWPITVGDIGNGKPIRVNGVLSPHGIGMHPPFGGGPASAKYRLYKEATLFKATVAVDDSTDWSWSPATFRLYGDGKELWSSEQISALKPHVRSQQCKVLVEGVDVLELRVNAANGNKGVHAVWVEPRVLHRFDSPDSAQGAEGVKKKEPGEKAAP
jgi:hypothetical protein